MVWIYFAGVSMFLLLLLALTTCMFVFPQALEKRCMSSHYAVQIRADNIGVRFSPWFSSEQEALAWLNADEVRKDHEWRFRSPKYTLQEFRDPGDGGDLVVIRSREVAV